jgi:hypothetical protein
MLPYKRTHAAQCRVLESMNDIIDTGQVLPYHTLIDRQQECKLPWLAMWLEQLPAGISFLIDQSYSHKMN